MSRADSPLWVSPSSNPVGHRTGDRLLGNQEIQVALNHYETQMDLQQPPTREAQRLRPLWHQVMPANGPTISVMCLDPSLPRIVRLTIESDAPGWNPRWVCWSYALRRLSEDEGGQTLAAQDMLEEAQGALTLLARGGERREASLQFQALLDGKTQPGDYPYRVVATIMGETDREQAPIYAEGLLCLRYPSSRLLAALPAVYAERPNAPPFGESTYEEPPFFERFLSGFEDTIEEMREKLRHLDRFFDASGTPSDFLPWLATWVALTLNENWPEMKRRRLIKEAVELYRWRGTRHGLSRYLEIYLDVLPEINDIPFAGMTLGSQALLGRQTTLGGVQPHTFTVTLSVPDPDQVDVAIVDAIIEAQRPAHTVYERRIVASS